MLEITIRSHWYEASQDKAKVDLYVREHDEPAVAVTVFHLAGSFGAANTAGRVLATTESVNDSIGESDMAY